MLRGQKVLVTGAGRGIGAAIAEALAGEGAQMLLCARHKEELEATAVKCEMSPGACMHMAQVLLFDLSTAEGVDALVTEVQKSGGVDVLVNNAGCMLPGNATEGALEDFDRQMYLNLLGPMRLTRQLAPKMVDKRRGTIINVGSVAAIESMSGSNAVYAASKHALRGWSLSIFESLRESNVKVMLVNPAFVATNMVSGVQGVNQDKMIKPSDVAETCLLPFRVSADCVPTEVTLRLAMRATE